MISDESVVLYMLLLTVHPLRVEKKPSQSLLSMVAVPTGYKIVLSRAAPAALRLMQMQHAGYVLWRALVYTVLESRIVRLDWHACRA